MCDRPTTVQIRTVAKMLALTSIGGTHSHATEPATIARARAAMANRFGPTRPLTMIFLKCRRESPSPPFRGEREGPGAKRWEGEVGISKRSGIRPLTPTLSPDGGEGAFGAQVD